MSSQIPVWRQVQRKNFTQISSLLDFLEISDRTNVWTDPQFILNLPVRLAEKIQKDTYDDPILRQFVPLIEEKKIAPGFVMDPVGDQTFCKTGKILQKYRGRALILTTSACVMNCRFCFRQNFPYATDIKDFQEEIEFIRRDFSLEEIILSGGDPLSLSDQKLSHLFNELDKIVHVKRIRIHTRFPIGIPERIDDSFLQILKNSRKAIYFVIHCNHPKELDDDVLRHLKEVQKLGISILSQTVPLSGVNDNEGTLFDLFQKMVNHGIIPYYLHLLDQVQGAMHFLVPDERAKQIMQYLQNHLSGYALPRLVREIPGQKSKTRIS